MSKIKSALINSSITSFSIQIIGLLINVFTARYLLPEEVGVYAIASAIAVILAEFKILGAGIYLIRETSIDEKKIRSALGLTIIFSWLLGFSIIILSFPIAEFYKIDDAPVILSIISVTFFIAPYCAIPASLHSRELNFSAQRIVKVSSAVVKLILTIALILLGLSYYSLALAYLGGSVCELILYNLFFKAKKMVYLPSFRGITPILKLGVLTSLAASIRKMNSVIPDMVIGKLGSPSQVALFSKGIGLSDFIFQTLRNSVGSVSLPFLATVKREGGKVEDAYLHGSLLFNAVVASVLLTGSMLSLPAIRLLFGDQWDSAAPVASFVMISLCIKSLNFQFSDFAVTMGKLYVVLIREVLSGLLIILAILFFFKYGLKSIALGFIVAATIDFIFILVFLNVKFNFSIKAFFMTHVKNAVVSIAVCAPTAALVFFFDFDLKNPFYPFLYSIIYLPISLYIACKLTGHPLISYIKFKN